MRAIKRGALLCAVVATAATASPASGLSIELNSGDSVSSDARYWLTASARALSDEPGSAAGWTDDLEYWVGSNLYLNDTLEGRARIAARDPGASGRPAAEHNIDGIVSTDGRHVAFGAVLRRPDLSTGGSGFVGGVWVRDPVSGTLELASRRDGDDGAPLGWEEDEMPMSMSDDGSVVAFMGGGVDVDPTSPAEPDQWQSGLLVRDLKAGTTRLINDVPLSDGEVPERSRYQVSVSGDGSVVAWSMVFLSLDSDDPLPRCETWVYIRATGETRQLDVSDGGAGCTEQPEVAADGSEVIMRRLDRSRLPEPGANPGPAYDIVAESLDHPGTEIVVPAGVAEPGQRVIRGLTSISDDGRFVGFREGVVTPTERDRWPIPERYDFVVHDRATGTATRSDLGPAYESVLSGDGRWVVFTRTRSAEIDRQRLTAGDEASDTLITSEPHATTAATTTTVAFSSTSAGADYECRLDGGGWAPCVSPQTVTTAPGHDRLFEVRARTSGDVDPTPAWSAWHVDDDLPDTTIVDIREGGGLWRWFDFLSSEWGSTFECRLDGVRWGSCGRDNWGARVESGDRHRFEVRAIDRVGRIDPTPATHEWGENRPPTLTLSPADVAEHLVSWVFSANETSTFQCSLDSGPSGSCVSPYALTDLDAGDHEISVVATDIFGTSATVTSSFVLDRDVRPVPPPVVSPPPTDGEGQGGAGSETPPSGESPEQGASPKVPDRSPTEENRTPVSPLGIASWAGEVALAPMKSSAVASGLIQIGVVACRSQRACRVRIEAKVIPRAKSMRAFAIRGRTVVLRPGQFAAVHLRPTQYQRRRLRHAKAARLRVTVRSGRLRTTRSVVLPARA